MLYLKYQEKIKVYKDHIENLSLKEICTTEEDAWINNKNENDEFDFQESYMKQADEMSVYLIYDFKDEIVELTQMLKDKIAALKVDFEDI